jgi:hypothetical protein
MSFYETVESGAVFRRGIRARAQVRRAHHEPIEQI